MRKIFSTFSSKKIMKKVAGIPSNENIK